MNLKAFALAMALFSTAAHADIIFHSQSLNKSQNVCDNVVGHWAGQGVVSTKMLTCHYKGEAVATADMNPYSYKFDVKMTLISGRCPGGTQVIVLPGTCNPSTGVIAMKSSDANLSGSLSADGQTANLTGTVVVNHVTAKVDKMELHKQ